MDDIIDCIEKSFNIKVSKDDILGLVRNRDIAMGDLYDFVLKKLHLEDIGRYDFRLNFRFWTEMRSLLHDVSRLPLAEIEPKTPLDQLFPRRTRRETWDELREACRYRVPELEYPGYVRTGGFLLAAAVFAIEQFHLWRIAGAIWFWPVLGFIGLWMFAETYFKILSVCAPLRSRLPVGMKTVKDLCRAVLAVNYVDICTSADIPIDERSLSTWEHLVEILSSALGVKHDQITFRSRLVSDLGME